MSSQNSLRAFAGAVAIVTGGASGIGRALAEALARRGATVVIFDLQGDLADEVAAGIRSAGGQATARLVDVRDFQAIEQLVQDTWKEHGRLDYLFNNAGIGIAGPIKEFELDDWYRIIDVNVRGVVNGVHAAYPLMLRQGFGHIVNTASMAGLMPAPGTTSYAASKFAVVGLSTSLRCEAAATGVRVSVLCPGVIRTPILDAGGKYGKLLLPASPEDQRRHWERLRPMAPERFAEEALHAVKQNRSIIILPSWWKLLWWLNRLSPSLGLFVSRSIYERTMRDLENAASTSQGTIRS
jgi:NAD(P)-dependent dehydrogenase (short-subunit alcohol dehydrogenase family)